MNNKKTCILALYLYISNTISLHYFFLWQPPPWRWPSWTEACWSSVIHL